ncbi:MAG: hypothetical protein P8179_23235 [Candidatus Thiodiazotropha sp.]
MTLTIKKSRPIKVNGEEFRYQISTTKIDDKWSFSLNITVQRWTPPRGVLEVKGVVTRDFWLDISDGKKWNIEDYPVVLPKHISYLIKLAIMEGWDSTETGVSYKINTENGAIFKQT